MPLPKTIIQRDFPSVKRIVDAKSTINITVVAADAAAGRKKDPGQCALARACIRQKIADAAIIGLSYSYLIKGDTAVRYKTSTAVSREITSFDRHQDFAPGKNYKLSKVSPKSRLGAYKGDGGPHLTTSTTSAQVHTAPGMRVPASVPPSHHTANVRIMRIPKNHTQ